MTTRVTNPDGSVSQVQMNAGVVFPCVDDQGNYLGLLSGAEGRNRVPTPPPKGEHWYWDLIDWKWVRRPPVSVTLAAVKVKRINEIRTECLVRVQVIYDGIDSWGALELIMALWTQGLANGAKSPQGSWAAMLAIANAARLGVQAVRSANTVDGVVGVTVSWP